MQTCIDHLHTATTLESIDVCMHAQFVETTRKVTEKEGSPRNHTVSYCVNRIDRRRSVVAAGLFHFIFGFCVCGLIFF
jgi:hypothetical protein